MGKKGYPEIVDKFTDSTERAIANGELEGSIPPETSLSIKNGYKINISGKVIGKKGIPLTHIHKQGKRSPVVIISINKKNTNGNIDSKEKEERIDKLMEKHFGQYIEGYAEMKHNKNKKYIVVPKNGEWNNMELNNLKYVSKKEYELSGTKKGLLIELIPFLKNKSDEDLATLLSTTRGWISRVKTELRKEGRIGNKDLNKLIISHKTYPIYIALLECKGLKSNLDIAKKLRPQIDFKNKIEKERLTEKVVRVRKKLYEKGLIEKYNTYQQEVNIKDVKDELKKTLLDNKTLEKGKRKTHTEIAEIFGLKKEQVDNYSRNIKK